MNRAVALLFLALLPICARAVDDKSITVEWLYSACQAPKDSGHHMYCVAYVRGIVDTLLLNGEMLKDDKAHRAEMGLCGTIGNTASVQAFKNWAEKHPEAWSQPMVAGVAVALQELWGCN
jgi:hypothetical protein